MHFEQKKAITNIEICQERLLTEAKLTNLSFSSYFLLKTPIFIPLSCRNIHPAAVTAAAVVVVL